jgi:hypothetical protein
MFEGELTRNDIGCERPCLRKSLTKQEGARMLDCRQNVSGDRRLEASRFRDFGYPRENQLMGKTGMRLRRLWMTFENADSSDIEMCW